MLCDWEEGILQAKVALVCDSSVCLPQDVVDALGVYVVPLELSIEGKTYLDGVDISPQEFYSLLAQCQKLPTTSAPSSARFIEAFTDGSAHAESILCLTLLSTVSATYQAAVAAAEMARETLPNTNIEVVDTRTAAGGQGLVVLAAARAAAQNADHHQVKAVAHRVMQGVELIAFLDTMHYISKGGRIPRIAAWAGSALKLKPMMELSQGDIRPLERPRTRKRAMERLLAIVHTRVGDTPIRANVMHALAIDDARTLRERLLSEFNCVEVLVSEFTPVMGAHTGPGLLGIAFHTEEGR
ncbi:DegV family protein [SAR202 cluster bacterium AC-647-N09_OGT_505m]|nr:DegV family protein [SAR202 cluster bacterium AC-647-N09_OGT_505m]